MTWAWLRTVVDGKWERKEGVGEVLVANDNKAEGESKTVLCNPNIYPQCGLYM